MSIHALTCDEFAQLSTHSHQVALGLYDAEIQALALALGQATDHKALIYQQQLDKLSSCLSLRKVHFVRLTELLDEVLAPSSAYPSALPTVA